MSMLYRRLGSSGLKVSALSFGAWVTFGKQIKDTAATKLLHTAYGAGVNFFDNAENYDDGEAERREEALFQLAGLADGESHIQRHREFERRINELYWSFLHRHSDRVTVGDSTRGDVEALLRQWLIDHVATEDRRYQPLVAGNDAALALMRAWED